MARLSRGAGAPPGSDGAGAPAPDARTPQVAPGADHVTARVGVISDTHGELDGRVAAVLAGVDLIVHAGDVCGDHILAQLSAVAPVVAARGNMDLARQPHGLLEDFEVVSIAGVRIGVVHDLDGGLLSYADVDVLVCGHTHRPDVSRHGGVMVFNPGSASRPRGGPRSLGILEVKADMSVTARVVALDEAETHDA